MKRSDQLRMALLTVSIFCSTVSALTFSKDSIEAFDGKFWNGYAYESDSVKIINNSANIVSIDSILIEYTDTLYAARSQTGWIERRGDDYTTRLFNIGNGTSERGVALSEYNSAAGNKITYHAGEGAVIYHVYLSTAFSKVGTFIECYPAGCYPPGSTVKKLPFGGRIIFVGSNERDTLILKGIRDIWTTATSAPFTGNKLPRYATAGFTATTFSLLGRKVSATNSASIMQLISETGSARIGYPAPYGRPSISRR